MKKVLSLVFITLICASVFPVIIGKEIISEEYVKDSASGLVFKKVVKQETHLIEVDNLDAQIAELQAKKTAALSASEIKKADKDKLGIK